MRTPKQLVIILATSVLAGAAACDRAPERLTPEAAAAKGDGLLREMSNYMAALQTFSYTADERREVVGTGGAKTMKHATRQVVIRRPNAATFTGSGDSGDTAGWYDGTYLTLASAKSKVWARGPMPPTLDEALDYLSAEYATHVPSADLLYSSPYDALMTKDTTGGWVDVQQIGERQCDHLAYRQEVVDWELWMTEKRLPCQIKIIYKTEPGQPAMTVTFTNLNTSPQVSDDTFTAKVPADFQRIRIVRHATVLAPEAPANTAATSGAPAPPKK
jgi:hypothetical protein